MQTARRQMAGENPAPGRGAPGRRRNHHGGRGHAHQQPVRGLRIGLSRRPFFFPDTHCRPGAEPVPISPIKGRRGGGEPGPGSPRGASAGAVAEMLQNQGVVPSISGATGLGRTRLNISLFKPRVGIDLLLFSRQIHTPPEGRRAHPARPHRLAGIGHQPGHEGGHQGRAESLEAAANCRSPGPPPQGVFPFYLSMVRVGESTGLLEEIFLRLFEHLEFERFMREQVKSALRYPMFVVIAMAAAIVVINLFVIPAFAKVFKGSAPNCR